MAVRARVFLIVVVGVRVFVVYKVVVADNLIGLVDG